MSTTLTGLIPDLYEAVDIVSRELVGFIPSVTIDAEASRAAIGQLVRSPVTSTAVATDITAAVTPPDDGNNTVLNSAIAITKARRVPVRWTGEQQLQVARSVGVQSVLVGQFAQAMRTLTNEIEGDLGNLHITTSRAFGVPGTTPFNTINDYGNMAFARQILVDNGSPTGDLRAVLNSTAGATMRAKQAAADAAGSDSLLRQGILLDVHGVPLRESAQVRTFVKGTAAGATTNTAGYAVGATAITLASAGTGAVKNGDIVTFAGDANMYVVAVGDTDVSNGGTITLSAPGLRQAIPASATAITVANNSARNMLFSQSAIGLAVRAPARPSEGDLAVDVTLITDPRSGITFEVSQYNQYRQVQFEVAIAWGVANFKPEHTALILG
jgi:hypothetical protein